MTYIHLNMGGGWGQPIDKASTEFLFYKVLIDEANMNSVTLSSKFQICIPKEIRESMNLKPGQELVLLPEGGVIHIMPKPSLEDIHGLAKGADISGYRERGMSEK